MFYCIISREANLRSQVNQYRAIRSAIRPRACGPSLLESISCQQDFEVEIRSSFWFPRIKSTNSRDNLGPPALCSVAQHVPFSAPSFQPKTFSQAEAPHSEGRLRNSRHRPISSEGGEEFESPRIKNTNKSKPATSRLFWTISSNLIIREIMRRTASGGQSC